MRAIIIEEERFAEVCELMEKAAIDAAKYPQHKPEDVTQEDWERALRSAHRAIHYTFVRWAQSHGASCTKR
jgi:hypothetical protein